jgi:phosphonate transport system substrate-binding protein
MRKSTFLPRTFLVLFVSFISLHLLGCDQRRDETINVSLKKVEKNKTITPEQPVKRLRIAISAVISPKETFALYRELLDYISAGVHLPVQLVQRETYEEVNDMIRDKEIDLAFVCSGAYIKGHDQFGMKILAAPVAYGKPVYSSYIIVPIASPIATVESLRGKRFAFTDPMSNTGKLAPTYMLSKMKEDIDTFFKSYIFTYSHDRSIEMVAHNLVDGAAVDGLIWEYMNIKTPSITAKTRIIKKSEPFGIPPVVVPPGLDPSLEEQLRNLFLNIHTDEKGRKILAKLMIDKFIILDDHKYDSIREMNTWINSK